MIIIDTVIGFGSSNEGTNKVHGNPLGKEDGKNAKISYGFDHDEFYVPEEVYDDLLIHVLNVEKIVIISGSG